DQIGHVPIPPYLKRPDEESDKSDYQTIFASERGAVAAPTAGLHFTPDLLQALKVKGVITAPLTLHVGIGTFRSVMVDNVEEHQMDAEMFIISPETADTVNDALQNLTRTVTVIGTTAVRAVESNISPDRLLKSGMGWTDKFIYPPYQFAVTQRLMTNFHMPESTLLMLVSALAGDVDFMLYCYKTAVKESYRLFSYGDAMLIV
ncbi:MAG TPA: S-adenosylmethionine:tRNA ribosyltransferase-isomerase, partial [Rhodothermales bacterium]|nr:S-adenosylmethionine:tRNA ribosyltransferase-isomerase [Rhodothermales bacterium]